jgi:regulator of cell morphogenesis and NO signaling
VKAEEKAMTLDTTQTVGEIARQYPASVPVFEAFGIDYCCGGCRSLEEACVKENVALNLVLSDLSSALVTRPTEDERHWITAPLAELADHIVGQHHAYSKRELPRLSGLAAKVRERHAHMHPELHQVSELVEAMSSEMCTHMLKEEQVLFPRLKVVDQAAQTGSAAPAAFFGPLINPIRHMLSEHDDTGHLLKSIRALTRDYKVPQDACMSYQALYDGLSALERDLHQHIHLENNILFPRALEFEQVQ